MAGLPTTLPHQIDARVTKPEDVFQFATVDDRPVTPVSITPWSIFHFLLCIALLIWPVISLLRDGLPHSLPILSDALERLSPQSERPLGANTTCHCLSLRWGLFLPA